MINYLYSLLIIFISLQFKKISKMNLNKVFSRVKHRKKTFSIYHFILFL